MLFDLALTDQVTSADPLKEVPIKCSPADNVFGVSAVSVISDEPSKATPLIFLVDARVVAVSALPINGPVIEDVEDSVIPFFKLVNPGIGSIE